MRSFSRVLLEAWFSIGATQHISIRPCGLSSSVTRTNPLGQAHEFITPEDALVDILATLTNCCGKS